MSGGFHEGEFPVAIWNTVTVHPESVKNTLDYLNRMNKVPHYIWRPITGEVLQCLPLDVAAKHYSKKVNRGGKPCIQIVVLMRGLSIQITDTLCKGLESILEALDMVGVPKTFPLGVPSPYGRSWGLLEVFPEAGHYAGNQIDPDLDGMGRLNVNMFFGGKRSE